MQKGLKIISLGFGVQSSALYFMSSLGILPRCDYAIFANPHSEKESTYNYIKYVQQWQTDNNGIPIIICNEKNLYDDLTSNLKTEVKSGVSIPAFAIDDDGKVGMINRQCTSDYKIDLIDKAIRTLYGLQPRFAMPLTEVWKGITMDEITRMSQPRLKWHNAIYPFIGYRTTYRSVHKMSSGFLRQDRNQVINWLVENGFRVPPKSSCVFCPFQKPSEFLRMKEENNSDWSKALTVDSVIRNSINKGVDSPLYLLKSGIPLSEIQPSFVAPDLFNENCSDVCHV
jgi:hypothetical protein